MTIDTGDDPLRFFDFPLTALRRKLRTCLNNPSLAPLPLAAHP